MTPTSNARSQNHSTTASPHNFVPLWFLLSFCMNVTSSIVKSTEPSLTEFAPNIKLILQKKLCERIYKINPYLDKNSPNVFNGIHKNNG